jgi:hypothetical protein
MFVFAKTFSSSKEYVFCLNFTNIIALKKFRKIQKLTFVKKLPTIFFANMVQLSTRESQVFYLAVKDFCSRFREISENLTWFIYG